MLSLTLFVALAAAVPETDHRPVYHYRRTNSDGSEAEDVVVFVDAPGRIAVMKEKSRCTNAAFVTAELDPASGQARALVGGRLMRTGTQQPFAWLTVANGGTHLVARIGAPDAPPLFDVAVHPAWRLFDFDFADLAAHPPAAIGARAPMTFDLPLLLTGGDRPTFTNRGQLRLSGAVATRHFGGPAVRYRASGPALAGKSGQFWFDARSGVLLEARLPLANHSEYRDFRLQLIRTTFGEASWKARLADHWRGCPAVNE